MGEPPGSVVHPERRQRNRPLVVPCHCRVKMWRRPRSL
jgi:hypothetical protein